MACQGWFGKMIEMKPWFSPMIEDMLPGMKKEYKQS
jgi:hypothetical protein